LDTTDTHQELEAVTEIGLPGEVATPTVGYENEDPAGEPQTADQADIEIRYAKASVHFRQAKAEYELARKELVEVVQRIGKDRDGLLGQRLASPLPVYEIPLPMTFAEIKLFTGWTTQKANSWVKYRLNTHVIKKRGKRGHYVYYYPSDPSGEGYAVPRSK
jgi:hypothetical protein